MTRVAVAVEGWNAEAAVGFALAARKFASSVLLTSSREAVDGKDEIDVVTLGPEPGEEVVMAVDGRDEKDAFAALLARLLSVIERPEHNLCAVLGQNKTGQGWSRTGRAPQPSGRVCDSEVFVLGSMEVIGPLRSRRKKSAKGSQTRKSARKAGPRKRKR